MDFVGYAALGGLERVTIVAGAIIIGYWGYRLYVGEKTAGIVFMGLAVLVLVGALATGTSHLRSVGEGLQLASIPPAHEAAPAPAPAPEPPATVAPSPFTGSETPASPTAEAQASAPAEAQATVPAGEASAAGTDDTDSDTAATEDAADAESRASPVRLATGQELGGRIVSVKSENVSLEWSSDSD